MTIGIAVFVYKRPVHTKKTLDALAGNMGSGEFPLWIFCDGAKGLDDQDSVAATRVVVEQFATGREQCNVVTRPDNRGLASSIIEGVTMVFEATEAVIVIEDDIVTAVSFLAVVSHLLHVYRPNRGVFSVSGFGYSREILPIPADYPFDVFFSMRNSTWGWATWKDRWSVVDWSARAKEEVFNYSSVRGAWDRVGLDLAKMLKDQQSGANDSWGIRFCLQQFVVGGVTVYPTKTLVHNIGLDGSGTHSQAQTRFQSEFCEKPIETWSLPQIPFVDERIAKAFRQIFQPRRRPLLKRIVERLRREFQSRRGAS